MSFRIVVNEPYDDSGKTYRTLEAAGCEVLVGRDAWEHPAWEYAEDELAGLAHEADVLMGASRERYTRRVLESGPRLRLISKYGIGVDRIDVAAATELGILVTNTPVYAATVSEHTLTLILALAKRIQHIDRYVRAGGWRDPSLLSMEIAGKTVGLIGLGRIGSAVAEKLRPWGVRLLVHDPYVSQERAAEVGANLVDLETLLREADVVSLHAVQTAENRKMIGEAQLRIMKPTAYVVNTSRGSLIDQAALARALEGGRLAGAALDVFEREPLEQESALRRLDNVILTPHVANYAPEAMQRCVVAGMEACLAALHGQTPQYVVNPQALPRWRERVARLGTMDG